MPASHLILHHYSHIFFFLYKKDDICVGTLLKDILHHTDGDGSCNKYTKSIFEQTEWCNLLLTIYVFKGE